MQSVLLSALAACVAAEQSEQLQWSWRHKDDPVPEPESVHDDVKPVVIPIPEPVPEPVEEPVEEPVADLPDDPELDHDDYYEEAQQEEESYVADDDQEYYEDEQPEEEEENTDIEKVSNDDGEETWLSDQILFSKSIWSGLYSGLYNKNKKGMVPKPTGECLGRWVIEDINNMYDFRDSMLTDYFGVSIDQYKKAWFATGDLMFKNFDQCHFKCVMEDVSAYCAATSETNETKVVDDEWSKYDYDDGSNGDSVAPKCSGKSIMTNVQSNVFALVTQSSALASQFQVEDWADQPADEKAYAYQHLGHTLGQIFVDLTGFKPTLLK